MRRLLGKLGPAWRASPLRRGVQVGALVLFLYLFLYVAWPYAEVFSGDLLNRKEWLPLELFLWLDPLVGLSTAIAARHWNVALLGVLAIALVGLVLPRGFCGYLCPLGTLIDAFDWLIGQRIRRLRVKRIGPWRHLRYYLLAAVLVSAAFGVLISGYVSAIPVVTRGLMFTVGRLQLGLLKNWGMAGDMTAAIWVSIALFAAIFLLGLVGPRFWCRYLCPSGALLSLFNLLRLTERRRESHCTACGRCARICPFDAIQPDYTTRPLECTFCQTCAGVCPVDAIRFGPRQRAVRESELPAEPLLVQSVAHGSPQIATDQNSIRVNPCRSVGETSLSRRGLVLGAVCGLAAAGATRFGSSAAAGTRLLRPPGAVDETDFLSLCIRCGECFKVCPGSVLQPAGLEAGLESLWTPVVVPTHAGCHQDCNFCTQVCPTHAIRPLTLQQKRKTVIGQAIIDVKTCLPHRGERDCQLCYEECEAAGYHAIQMRQINLKIGEVPPGMSQVELDEMSHINAPFVDPSACVGCGLCEYRCHIALVKQQKLLTTRAVLIKA